MCCVLYPSLKVDANVVFLFFRYYSIHSENSQNYKMLQLLENFVYVSNIFNNSIPDPYFLYVTNAMALQLRVKEIFCVGLPSNGAVCAQFLKEEINNFFGLFSKPAFVSYGRESTLHLSFARKVLTAQGTVGFSCILVTALVFVFDRVMFGSFLPSNQYIIF